MRFDLQYDIPVEVTEKQYKAAKSEFGGIIAHRKENGKYYIKLWLMAFKSRVEQCLENNK